MGGAKIKLQAKKENIDVGIAGLSSGNPITFPATIRALAVFDDSRSSFYIPSQLLIN